MGDVEVAPSDPDIVWVGTGEANAGDFWGDGVYKSTDGGDSWQHMGLTDSRYVGRIRIHPQNPDIVYVAAVGYGFSDNAERGVYKTTDGGRTWANTLEVVHDGRHVGTVDLVMDSTDPETLYAATWDRECLRQRSRCSPVDNSGSGIYKTVDGGDSWTRLTNGLPTGRIGRIGVDAYLRDPRILYAVIEEPNPSGGRAPGGIYRTDDGGSSWTKMGDALGSGGWFGQIRVDPNDPDVVYNFESRMDKSTDGGRTWARAFRWGGDWHALWINPDSSNHLLGGYDYGFAISYDGGEVWNHSDNMSLAQFYFIGVDMEYPYNVFGGSQDFGTWKAPNTNKTRYPLRFENWTQVGTLDGAYTQVDPTDGRWLYYQTEYGGFQRFDQADGTKKRLQYFGDGNLRFNFAPPILISPHNSDVIYHGANVVLRSNHRGENWQEISQDLTNYAGEVRSRGDHSITTLAESPVERGVIWAGTDDGNVQGTRDDGETWTKLNDRIPDNPEYWVSRVIASHHQAGTAYVAYNGRRWDDFRPFL